MIRELVQPTDPILRQECDKFDFADPQMDPKELEEMLKFNMVAHKGIGFSVSNWLAVQSICGGGLYQCR